MSARALLHGPSRSLAALARAARAAVKARLRRYAGLPASDPPATPGRLHDAPAGNCAAVASYLEACDAARKAWHQSGLLARIRPDRVREVREALRHASAATLAGVICDMAGPLHPGDPARTGAAFTKSASQLAATVIEALLPPVLAERHERSDVLRAAPATGENASPMLDAALLKRCITHWIRCGRLPSDLPPALEAASAAQISEFLLAQRGDVLAPEGEEAATLRLSVVAMTAPAIESLLVMSKVSDSLLAVLESQRIPGAEEERQEALQRESAVARTADDDLVAERAFRNLQGRPVRHAPASRR